MRYDAPDWCPPFGLPRPDTLPPDDDVTDTAAWLAAEFDARYTTPFTLQAER